MPRVVPSQVVAFIDHVFPKEGISMQTATLFHHDHSQAVQLPQEFQFPGTQVYVKQVGNALVLLPMDQPWDPLVASLGDFSEDFMAERNQPPVQPRDDASA